VVWLTRGTCRSFESGVLAAVPTNDRRTQKMEVMIGVDPHKVSHTATMVDRRQRELRQITVRAGHRAVEQLLEWVDGVKPRTWAVESAGGMG
jgi:hypothetical protein